MPLIDVFVTRFPNGVTNVGSSDLFNSFKAPNPLLYHTQFNDFDTYAAGDWTVTETQAGATEALAAGDGGLLLLTNSAADNDIVQIQNAIANFTITAGKKFFFQSRFKVSDATQSDLAVGLQLANVDGCTLATATDGIFFHKADGATSVDVYFRKNNTTGSSKGTAVATLADDTFITLGAFYDGVDRLYYAVNGTVTGYIDAGSAYLPDANVALIFSLTNGEAAAKTATVDYLFAAQER